MCSALAFYLIFLTTLMATARRNPSSPCSEIFKYVRRPIPSEIIFPTVDNPVWRGAVSIPKQYLGPGDTAALKVVMTSTKILQHNFFGNIELSGEDKLGNLQYDVTFPYGIPVPYLKQIIFNGRILCNGILPRSSVQTNLILEHKILQVRVNLTSTRIGINSDDLHRCGKFSRNNPLIVHGKPTSSGEWPWLVPIFLSHERGLKFFCSGTLIDDLHIVSAAHCFKDVHITESLMVYVGKHNIQNWTENESQPRTVKKIVIHPEFDARTLYSDVAILEMSAPVLWSSTVAPACLWTGPETLDLVVGRQGTVVGWGFDMLNSTKITAEPNAIILPIVSQEQCLRSKSDYLHFTSNRTFCAGEKNGSGPCNGDSGGGLYLPISGRWHLRGIVSLSLLDTATHSCNLNQFIVFADVAKFSLWIQENILIDR